MELTLPATVLTHFTLVDTPAAGAFTPAYTRIALDTAERGGVLLVTMDAEVLPSQAELDFLVAAAQRAMTPFFAVWAGDGGPGLDADPTEKFAAYRDIVAARVPRFADAPWFLVVPGSGAADLRQALADWAGGGGPGAEPAASGHRTVPTAVDGRESGWEDLLDRVVKAAQHGVRQRLALELANVHLRCVQDIVFGDGCQGLPAALDREMHALSLCAGREVEAAVTEIIRQVLAHVLAEAPYDAVLRRVAGALRRRIEEDGPDLDQVLLITSTGGGVAALDDAHAAAAMSAYPSGEPDGVLPALAIGLLASCWQKKWHDDVESDREAARGWLQQAVRGTELELQRVLAERFEVVRQVLNALVAEAVDHGLLLV